MENNLLFPKDFLFGTATAAYQIEGAWNEDGKGENIWDRYAHSGISGIHNGVSGDVVTDHYHRLEEDLDLLKELNCESYRFSISWARVLPDGIGRVNQKGIDFYNRLIDGLLARNIQPMATLYHWDFPAKLQNLGGWANPACVSWFVEYATLCFKEFGDRVSFWCTFNEPNAFLFSAYALPYNPPFLRDAQLGLDASHYALMAHGAAVRAFREMNLPGKIGIALDLSPVNPASDSKEDTLAAQIAMDTSQYYYYHAVVNGKYPQVALDAFARLGFQPPVNEGDMALISEPLDFIGLNYYFTRCVRFKKGAGRFDVEDVDLPEIPHTEFGWFIDPKGLETILQMVHKDTDGKIPLYITENGTSKKSETPKDGIVNDPERIDYLKKHLAVVKDAIEQGINLRGYLCWSAFDNLEWHAGYSQRFGLIHVDFDTLKRTVKESGKWFASIIAQKNAQK